MSYENSDSNQDAVVIEEVVGLIASNMFQILWKIDHNNSVDTDPSSIPLPRSGLAE